MNEAGRLLFGHWWMRIHRQDESVCPHLIRDGYWESWVSLAVARAIRPGWRVVDAGAHVGWYTFLALARGAERVFAVEPQPDLSALLRRSLEDNGLADRADHWSGALGEAYGARDLLLYGNLTGSASLEEHAAEGWTPTGRGLVGVAPLDGLLLDRPGWRRVDLVKVDVEGAEVQVWRGMQKTLAANPQAAVVMEVAARRGYDVLAFLREMADAGWRARFVADSGSLTALPEDPGRLFKPEAAHAWETLWIDRPEAEEERAP